MTILQNRKSRLCFISCGAWFRLLSFFYSSLFKYHREFLNVHLHRCYLCTGSDCFWPKEIWNWDPTLNYAATFVRFVGSNLVNCYFFGKKRVVKNSRVSIKKKCLIKSTRLALRLVPPHLQSAPRWHIPRQSLKPPCYPKSIQQQAINHSASAEKEKKVKKKKETCWKHIVGSVITGSKRRAKID